MVTHGLGEDALDCRRVFVQQMLQAGKYMRTVEQGKQRLEVDSETGIGLVLPSNILGYTRSHRLRPAPSCVTDS